MVQLLDPEIVFLGWQLSLPKAQMANGCNPVGCCGPCGGTTNVGFFPRVTFLAGGTLNRAANSRAANPVTGNSVSFVLLWPGPHSAKGIILGFVARLKTFLGSAVPRR